MSCIPPRKCFIHFVHLLVVLETIVCMENSLYLLYLYSGLRASRSLSVLLFYQHYYLVNLNLNMWVLLPESFFHGKNEPASFSSWTLQISTKKSIVEQNVLFKCTNINVPPSSLTSPHPPSVKWSSPFSPFKIWKMAHVYYCVGGCFGPRHWPMLWGPPNRPLLPLFAVKVEGEGLGYCSKRGLGVAENADAICWDNFSLNALPCLLLWFVYQMVFL